MSNQQELRQAMAAEARDVLGSGYVPDYYLDASSGFAAIAEHALASARAEAAEQLRVAANEAERGDGTQYLVAGLTRAAQILEGQAE